MLNEIAWAMPLIEHTAIKSNISFFIVILRSGLLRLDLDATQPALFYRVFASEIVTPELARCSPVRSICRARESGPSNDRLLRLQEY